MNVNCHDFIRREHLVNEFCPDIFEFRLKAWGNYNLKKIFKYVEINILNNSFLYV